MSAQQRIDESAFTAAVAHSIASLQAVGQPLGSWPGLIAGDLLAEFVVQRRHVHSPDELAPALSPVFLEGDNQ